MKKLTIWFLILFVSLGIISLFIIELNYFKLPAGNLPDWIIKPKANYSGLYCGIYNQENIMQQTTNCYYSEINLLNEGYYRVKGLFGPSTPNSTLRFVVFNISLEGARGNISQEDLFKTEIKDPYEEVYFCGMIEPSQEFFECMENIDSAEEMINEMPNCNKQFYNLELNEYIKNNQLEEFCTKII